MKLYPLVLIFSFGSAIACDGIETDYDSFKLIQSIVQGSDCEVRYTKYENHLEMSCGQYRMHFQFEKENVCVLKQERIPEY